MKSLVASAVLALSLLVCVSSFAQQRDEESAAQSAADIFTVHLFPTQSTVLTAAAVMPAIVPQDLPDAPRPQALIGPTNAVLVAVVPKPKVMEPRLKVMDKKFLALGVLVFGTTSLDMELTQHCLQRRQCVELNPTLSTNHWGMYLENTPINLGVMWLAHKRREGGHRDWWIWPALDAGIHMYGVTTNYKYAWVGRR